MALPPVRSASGTFVVYPPSHTAIVYGTGATPRFSASLNRVSIDTPSQRVSNFDHLVTQWMSVVSDSLGSARNSSHDHRTVFPSTSRSVKSHFARGTCGVGPAERTG